MINKNNTVLLVGNDINNINNNQSWQDLLKKIINYLDIDDLIDTTNVKTKPFPLLYEEIFLRALSKQSCSEVDLKKFIAKLTNEIEHNAIHERIMNLGISDVLTTNYEYSLQKASNRKKEDLKNLGHIIERTYSIFRHNQVDKTKVWHIHGECNIPKSITLGYEHYGGLLQQMRNYVVTGTNYTKEKNLYPLVTRIDKNEVKNHSWLDFFFTKDIHILGLSLDTSEIDLWWLLTFRARQLLRNKGRVENKIYFYYPTRYKEPSKEKLELLEANQVNVIEISDEDKTKYYNNILDKIEQKII